MLKKTIAAWFCLLVMTCVFAQENDVQWTNKALNFNFNKEGEIIDYIGGNKTHAYMYLANDVGAKTKCAIVRVDLKTLEIDRKIDLKDGAKYPIHNRASRIGSMLTDNKVISVWRMEIKNHLSYYTIAMDLELNTPVQPKVLIDIDLSDEDVMYYNNYEQKFIVDSVKNQFALISRLISKKANRYFYYLGDENGEEIYSGLKGLTKYFNFYRDALLHNGCYYTTEGKKLNEKIENDLNNFKTELFKFDFSSAEITEFENSEVILLETPQLFRKPDGTVVICGLPVKYVVEKFQQIKEIYSTFYFAEVDEMGAKLKNVIEVPFDPSVIYKKEFCETTNTSTVKYKIANAHFINKNEVCFVLECQYLECPYGPCFDATKGATFFNIDFSTNKLIWNTNIYRSFIGPKYGETGMVERYSNGKIQMISYSDSEKVGGEFKKKKKSVKDEYIDYIEIDVKKGEISKKEKILLSKMPAHEEKTNLDLVRFDMLPDGFFIRCLNGENSLGGEGRFGKLIFD